MENITKDIAYVGVNDHKIDLFEGQYIVPNGMAYNSYIIFDEKICVMDSVDASFTKEWLDNIEKELEGKIPSYLVIQHVEPDHSSNVMEFLKKYPTCKAIGNNKTFLMLKNFFGKSIENKLVVKDGDEISLGKHNLKFIFAPMVHWPEVMVTYDSFDKVLFSADGFGKFGALDVNEDWACEARRYYFGIVGKYGLQVSNLLKKAASLDIKIICPLHGPVLKDNLDYYIGLYKTWANYEVEQEGIAIAYCSVYGNTKKACELLKNKLENKGQKVVLMDLARSDLAECVEDAFKYGKLILASLTYNGDVFPFMSTFIHALLERNYQNRTIGFIENGSWAPLAAKVMRASFENSKNINFINTVVRINSSLDEQSKILINAMCDELLK